MNFFRRTRVCRFTLLSIKEDIYACITALRELRVQNMNFIGLIKTHVVSLKVYLQEMNVMQCFGRQRDMVHRVICTYDTYI